MNAKIQKWGNSLALRIPKAFAAEARLKQGAVVDLAVVDGKVILNPDSPPNYCLDELLGGVSKQNIHSQVDTGPAVGREVW